MRHSLRAAVTVWRYSAATCRLVFAKDVAQIADDLPNRLLGAIRRNASAGLRLTDLHAVCGRKERADAIHAALTALEQAGAVERREVATAGRPAERWYPRAWAGSLGAFGGTQQQGESVVFDLPQPLPQPERTNEASAGGEPRPGEGILRSFAGDSVNAEGTNLLRSPDALDVENANTPPCSSDEPLALPEEWKELRPPARPAIEDYFALWDGNPPEKARAFVEEMFANWSTPGILEWDVKDPKTKELIEFMA